MKKGLRFVSVFLLITLLLVSLVGCGSQETNNEDIASTSNEETSEKITIIGIADGDKTITIDELKEKQPIIEEMKSIDSSGKVVTNKVKGACLEKILNEYGESQKDFTGIRFIAEDGYSIVVPKEILEIRDIVLSYEIDDEPLHESSKPIRVAIPDERSMYWVKNLAKIELLEKQKAKVSKKIVFIDSAATNLEQDEYNYYDSQDKAIKVEDLVNAYSLNIDDEGVYFKASDKFEKEEDLDVFKSAYIKITGENNPMFLSKDLPVGMHIKNIVTITHGTTVYFSLNQGLKLYELKTADDHEGIALKDILDETKLIEADKYICTAADGYESEISKDDIDKGIIYERNNGGYTLMFEGMPKNTKIKQILSIEPVK